jgi:hypothetical protein
LATGISARLTPRQGREFGVKVGLAFGAMALLLLWRHRETAALVAGGLGALLVTGGLLAPSALGPVYRGWMGLALLLSKVTTPLFLGIVYYIVLTPVGVIRRRLGRNPLVQPLSDGSYWIRRPARPPEPSGMTRPF